MAIGPIRLSFAGQARSFCEDQAENDARQRHALLQAGIRGVSGKKTCATKPQPKSNQTFHHESREEHEVKLFEFLRPPLFSPPRRGRKERGCSFVVTWYFSIDSALSIFLCAALRGGSGSE